MSALVTGIKNHVYKYELVLLRGGAHTDGQRLFEAYRRSGARARLSRQGATFFVDGELSHAIWFPVRRPRPALIAHESAHSVAHILRTVGIWPIVESNEEAFAYLLEWTTDQIAHAISTTRRGKR